MTAIVALVLRILLAGALYTFLGLILYTILQEIRQQSTILASQKKPAIHINAKMENGKEINHHFWQKEIMIGRNTNCDISLIDEAVSTFNARISHHHTQWWLEDLDSTNGTFLNKNQVTVPTVIITDDQFNCGNTFFTIRIDNSEDKISHENTS